MNDKDIDNKLILTQIDVIDELSDENILLKEQLKQYKTEELIRHFEYEDLLKELLLDCENEELILNLLEEIKKDEEKICVIF